MERHLCVCVFFLARILALLLSVGALLFHALFFDGKSLEEISFLSNFL